MDERPNFMYVNPEELSDNMDQLRFELFVELLNARTIDTSIETIVKEVQYVLRTLF